MKQTTKQSIASLGLVGLLSVFPLNNAIAQSHYEKDIDKYAEYTANFEGRRSHVYDPNPRDNKEEPTIGVGHYLGKPNSREIFKRALPEVNYEDILSRKTGLNNNQIDKLFSEDLLEYVKTARRLFKKFDSYPLYLRQALVDGCYRGDLLDSPKTREFMNEDNWEKASREYVNRIDYKRAKENGMRGIITRMDKNRDAMLRYAKSLSN